MKFHKNMTLATNEPHSATPATPKAQNNTDLSTLQRTAYEAFKLHWMICHGLTAADLLAKYSDYWGEVESDEEGMYDFWAFLEGTGFNGEIWPCFNEFLVTEFRDVNLMHQLLSDVQYGVYLTHIQEIIVGGPHG